MGTELKIEDQPALQARLDVATKQLADANTLLDAEREEHNKIKGALAAASANLTAAEGKVTAQAGEITQLKADNAKQAGELTQAPGHQRQAGRGDHQAQSVAG